MTRWQQVQAVSGWEFRRFVKWKQQVVSVVIMLALSAAWAGFRAVSNRVADRRSVVAVVGAPALGFPLPSVSSVTWNTATHATAQSARAAVQDDSVAGALLVTSSTSAELVVRRRAAWIEPLTTALTQAQRAAAFAALPISPSDRARLATPLTTRLTTVTASGAQVSRATRIFAFAILGAGLLVLFTGFATLFTGITGEKQQRITEQMIAMVSPQTWMDGKIIGLTGAALVGTGVTALGGWLAIRVLPALLGREAIALPSVASDASLLLLVLLITTLGVAMWFAFMAAIAATIDDPNTSSRSVLLFVPMLPTGVAFSMLSRADSVVAQVLSVFPLTSMGMLPARLLTTAVPWWEVSLGIAMLVGAAWVFRRAAGKIFATGVLMYGKEPTLRELWRWARES